MASYSKRLENFFFYILIIAIPFQLRKVFYGQGWAFNEWQSMSVYLTDIILAILLLIWFWRLLHKETKISFAKHDYWLLGFGVLVGISMINSFDIRLSVFSWIKLLEFVLFYFYLKDYALNLFGGVQICLAFMVGGFFQSIIAISQFAFQSDVGFHWLGEGRLGPDLPGVAVFINSMGERIMRAYGTTPHANVLAGYLLACLAALTFAWHYFAGLKFKKLYYLLMSTYGLIFFAFFLTFSRTALFAWGIGFVGFVIYEYFSDSEHWPDVKRLFIFSMLLGVLFSIFFWPELSARLFLSSSEEAVSMRVYFTKESVDAGQRNWFGVGAGNFTNWLMDNDPGRPAWVYQPVHNLYLLIYSEVGILALLSFLGFLFYLLLGIKRVNPTHVRRQALILVYVIMFIAFFDHYLWTLQQGHFLWWGVLGLGSHLVLTKGRIQGKM